MKTGILLASLAMVLLLVSASASALHTIRPRPDFPFRDSTISSAQICDVFIEKFDYSNKILKGDASKVTVSAINTGDRRETITLKLFSGNSLIGSFSRTVERGQRISNEFSYMPTASHQLRLSVETNCGVSKTRTASIEVIVIEPPQERPVFVLEREDKPTAISVNPAELDIKFGQGEVIEISIETDEEEEFDINIEGVPQDWVVYEKGIAITGERKSLIFITPKELGIYTLTISVSSNKGTEFTQDVKLFVAVPLEVKSMEQLSPLETIGALLTRAYEVIVTNPRFFGTLVISFLLFALTVGAVKLKKEEIF